MTDRLARLAYRSAYQLLRVYWRLVHPTTHGALVALWHGGEILLVETSYLPYRSLPGGAVKLRETAREAAIRELREEVGILVRADELREVDNRVHAHNGKLDHVVIFDLELAMRPKVVVDNREIVAAKFYPPDKALALPLFPPIRDVIEAKVA